MAADQVQALVGARRGGAGRALYQRDHGALVLVGEEGAGQADEQERHDADDQRIDQHRPLPAARRALDPLLVPVGTLLEGAVEPAEEARKDAVALVLFLGVRLEDRRAQGWRQDQRDHHRQHHRRDDRDRELTVDHTRRSAEERHRQEHRGQHHADADQRAGDFVHRLARRVLRAEPLVDDQTLDVLDHDDGVVDQEADGEHHTEQGERVDRIAGHGHHREGAEQHHRHCDGRDQRRPPVLQEQEHDEEDEYHRLDQRMDHLLDRQPHERRGVERIDDLHVGREALGDRLDLGLDRIDGVKRVGTRRKPDAKARRRLAVVERVEAVVFGAQLDPCHVTQANHCAVRVGLQADRAEFLRRLKARLYRDGRVQHLLLGRGLRADLAGGDLRVLRLHRARHVGDGELIIVELERIDPDAHRILRAEDLQLANAVDAADRILESGHHHVRQVGDRVRSILRIEADDHQEAGGRLLHLDTLLLHFLR